MKRLKKVRDSLQDTLSKNKVDSIYIEENLQSFRAGFSSARTLSTLSRFNGMVSFNLIRGIFLSNQSILMSMQLENP